MSDRILLERIAVMARHGVFPEEAQVPQRFLLSLDCRLDLGPAGRSDALADTVSYADLAALAARVATKQRFRLIEALAERIAAEALAAFPPIEAVTVRVDKPDAPMPVDVAGIAVEITRRRDA